MELINDVKYTGAGQANIYDDSRGAAPMYYTVSHRDRAAASDKTKRQALSMAPGFGLAD